MKNQNESLETDAKPKMLFNSDGFNFLIKFMTVLFKIVGAVALVFVKIVFAFCETKTDKSITKTYVSLDPLKTEGENKVDGTGYYKLDN